jgi:uncharacterized protein
MISSKVNSFSKLCLGTAQFGLDYGINNQVGKLPEDQIKDILDFAHSVGIIHLDTADAYGDALKRLGRYFLQSPEDFVVHNKFSADDANIEDKLCSALFMLNKPEVETYYFHNYSDVVNHPSYLEQMVALREKKLIKRIGISIYDNQEFKSVCDHELIDVIQLPFNLLDNYHQRGELIEHAISQGKKLHFRSIFLQGLFFMNPNELPRNLTSLLPYLKRLDGICIETGLTIGQLAMGYAMQCKAADKVIIGVDTLEQLKQNVKLCETVLPVDIVQEIDRVRVQEVNLLYPKNWF